MGQRWENISHRSKGLARTHAIGNKIKYTAGRHDKHSFLSIRVVLIRPMFLDCVHEYLEKSGGCWKTRNGELSHSNAFRHFPQHYAYFLLFKNPVLRSVHAVLHVPTNLFSLHVPYSLAHKRMSL